MADEQDDPIQERQDDLLERLGLHPAQLAVQRRLLGAAQGDSSGLTRKDPAADTDAMPPAKTMPRLEGENQPTLEETLMPGDGDATESPIKTMGRPSVLPSGQTDEGSDAVGHQETSTALVRPATLQRPSMFSDAENNISKKHHFWGGVLKGLDVAGTIFSPGAMKAIPGSMLNQRTMDARAINTRRARTEQAQQDATVQETRARTEKLQHPPGEVKEEQLLYDKNGTPIGYRDQKGKYYSPADLKQTKDPDLQAVSRVIDEASPKAPPVKEGEMPLGDRRHQLNAMLESRYQVLNPGRPLPGQYTLPENATQKDYDRIDKGLEAEESAVRSKAQRDQISEMRRQTFALSQKKQTTEEAAIETAAQALAKMDPNDLTSLKDISSMRGDQRLLIYNRAKQINPKFNTSEVDRKIKMSANFTTGKDGLALQSFGTFLEHAGAASSIVDAIRKDQSTAKIINKPVNWWRNNVSGSAAFTQLIAALEPVKTEAENFMLNGHAMHVEDKKAVDTILSENSSPAQMDAAIKQLGHTVQARFTEMNHRYKGVMKQDIPDAFSDEALQGAEKIGLDLGGGKAQGGSKEIHYKIVNGELVRD